SGSVRGPVRRGVSFRQSPQRLRWTRCAREPSPPSRRLLPDRIHSPLSRRGLGAALALVIVSARGIDVVASPRVLRTVRATGCAFPFLLGGQPCARPLAICRSLMPRHVHHEPIRMLLLLVPVL